MKISFQNYASLVCTWFCKPCTVLTKSCIQERHFKDAHFPCSQPTCLEKKFVVFGSAIDLQAHMVEQHGTTMSAKDKRDARRVAHDFEFNETSSSTDRRRQMIRPRDRDQQLPPQQARSSRMNGSGARPSATEPSTDPPDRSGVSPLPSLEGDSLTTESVCRYFISCKLTILLDDMLLSFQDSTL